VTVRAAARREAVAVAVAIEVRGRRVERNIFFE
jgi:hypothetical protein